MSPTSVMKTFSQSSSDPDKRTRTSGTLVFDMMSAQQVGGATPWSYEAPEYTMGAHSYDDSEP